MKNVEYILTGFDSPIRHDSTAPNEQLVNYGDELFKCGVIRKVQLHFSVGSQYSDFFKTPEKNWRIVGCQLATLSLSPNF